MMRDSPEWEKHNTAGTQLNTEKLDLFEKTPVRQAVLKLVVPSVLSQVIVLLYNLADTYFIGLLNDPRQTAAVTVSAPAFLMLSAVANLFAVGGAGRVSSALGRQDYFAAECIAAIAFWFGAISAVLFSIIFSLTANPILTLCGATDQTCELAYGYVKWTVIYGGTGTILNLILCNLIRSEGNAGIAAIGVALGCIANIILDPLFILPHFCNLGAVGAGMATGLSNLLATTFFLFFLLKKRKTEVININPRHLCFAHAHLSEIISVGIPSALQYALTVMAVAALSKFVSAYGNEAVAGMGIVKKIDQLPLFFSIGVANGLMPLLAYNSAAGNHSRRRDAFRFGCGLSLGFSCLCLVIFELTAPTLTELFIKDEITIIYSSRFLRIMVIAMPMMSVCYPLIVQFQAMRRVKEALICSLLRKGILDIPLLFFFDHIIPLYGCMLVQPVVDTVSLLVALLFYRRIQDKQGQYCSSYGLL